jgi:hypothetical protein
MQIINTAADLANAELDSEHIAFLNNLLNDYITFDDAKYSPDYDHMLKKGDAGFIEPVLRKEWNAGAAAAWGFNSQDSIKKMLPK